ncbi:hypothetical protein AcV5_003621 [Taiwanofungus camphoratus]|nr:hypothetical protein AcV5_003621 [Antrodia cinnamomea]KAI0958301.1 hypothetical protein AcV7_004157 [Antrodia cinnamomea]
MLGSIKTSTVLYLFSLYIFGFVSGVPIALPQSQENPPALAANGTISQPMTVQMNQTVQTASGPMMQTCSITLTPIAGQSGEVQEIKSCTLSAMPGPADASPSGGVSSAGGSDPAAGVDSPMSIIGETTIPASLISTAAPAATASDSAAASGVTSVAASGTAAAGLGGPSGSALADNSPTAANNAAGATSATAEADAAASSPPPFPIPGRHIMILPVGLVIFCVITGITILVVMFVTYERMRYRKAFRKRKLAEQGAAMGYGGMG